MSNHAYIKLVKKSEKQTITLDELKEYFHYYKNITSKTGQQLNFGYEDAAFPYEIAETPEGKGKWFYLKGTFRDYYRSIVLAIDEEEIENEDGESTSQTFIQVVLPEGSTHGDKSKANEFCKFLANKLKAELQLFNGRTMYFYKR
ncbi:DUF1885 family protein [Anaerobacillus sp. MEB173]|uniref:DUF1885 family protein n=1 Tax=Anaerobacillus sp. MEB173 TaxID=3383345 RepID=UPI003F90C610